MFTVTLERSQTALEVVVTEKNTQGVEVRSEVRPEVEVISEHLETFPVFIYNFLTESYVWVQVCTRFVDIVRGSELVMEIEEVSHLVRSRRIIDANSTAEIYWGF